MSTEKLIRIRCDDCHEGTELDDITEISERELRADLKKRFGWVSYRTDRGWRDICPACVKGGK